VIESKQRSLLLYSSQSGKNLAIHTRVTIAINLIKPSNTPTVPNLPTVTPTIANGHSCRAQAQ